MGQGYSLKRTLLPCMSVCDFYCSAPSPQTPEHLYILLHGYGESAQSMLQHFKPLINENKNTICVPNGPFPIPKYDRKCKPPRWKIIYAWYFFDSSNQTYFINQDYAVSFLYELIIKLNLQKVPCTIIGFSQGGYLAPFVGNVINTCKRVIGINCEFKDKLLPKILPFELIGINGEDDLVVDPINAKKSHQKIINAGNKGNFQLLKNTGHDINSNILQAIKPFLL